MPSAATQHERAGERGHDGDSCGGGPAAGAMPLASQSLAGSRIVVGLVRMKAENRIHQRPAAHLSRPFAFRLSERKPRVKIRRHECLLQDSDISWQMLRRIVHDWVGTSAELAEVKRLDGGCVNTTLALTTQAGDRAVLKISPHRVNRQLPRRGLPAQHPPRDRPARRRRSTPAASATSTRPSATCSWSSSTASTSATPAPQCTDEQFDRLQMHLAELVLAMHNNTHATYTRVTDGEPRGVRRLARLLPPRLRLALEPVREERRSSPQGAARRSAGSTSASRRSSPTTTARDWCIGTSGRPTSSASPTSTGGGGSAASSTPTASTPTPRPSSRTWTCSRPSPPPSSAPTSKAASSTPSTTACASPSTSSTSWSTT